jgi:hypothetical protein
MLNALVRKSSITLGALLVTAAAAAGEAARELAPGYEEGMPVLRLQKDAARGRGWLLTASGVFLFDLKTRRTMAHVSLPGWVWVGEEFSCPPDLAIGPDGEALISSNVEPTLLRVDPVTFAVSRHTPLLDADTDKDVGFTGLTFSSAQGTFYAVSHFGALWRIDRSLRRAQKVDLPSPMPRACGVAIRATKSGFNRFFGLCVRGQQGGWTVNLAPDRRSGYVVGQPCSPEQHGSDK